MQKNKPVSEFSQKVITFFGYWWVALSVLLSLWELAAKIFAFNLSQNLKIILLCAALLITVVIAFTCLKSFPYILDRLFNRQAIDEKYFNISELDHSNFLKAIVFTNMPYVGHYERLLTPLIDSCKNKDYEQAIKIGLSNSPMLYHMKNNYIRVINGFYSLYAVEKAKSIHLIRDKSPKYNYAYCYMLINDLGWSICQLSVSELEKVKKYLENNKMFTTEFDISSYINLQNSPVNVGLSNIKRARDILESQRMHYKLIAQAIRHMLNFRTCMIIEPDLFEKLKKCINNINNPKDKNEMLGNSYYYLAYQKLKEQEEVGEYEKKVIEKALEEIDIASDYYIKIDDNSRLSKCYNVKGRLLLFTGNQIEAKREFEIGLQYARKVIRFDQIIVSLEYLSEIESDEKKRREYSKEGLSVSLALGDSKYTCLFQKKYKPKQIILIRHGESMKNITPTVSGEGELTCFGKEHISILGEKLNNYLIPFDYSSIKIYGYNKRQVVETAEILSEKIENSCIEYDALFSPTYMGDLHNVQETETNNANIMRLKKWRAGLITIDELNVPNMDLPILNENEKNGYWYRAEKIIELLTKEECSIVVCTTSLEMILTQYLINSTFNLETYKHMDVPLGGMVHFVEDVNERESKYMIVNKEYSTNIDYRKL